MKPKETIRVMKIVFATHNKHKLKEVQKMLPKNMELMSLTDIGCHDEIPETTSTLEGNAQLKADYVTRHYGYDCFADDTGLEVTALNGAPGVYSARYAGIPVNDEANMHKLLDALKDETERSAQFRTVIALNLKGKQYLFEGLCKGAILHERRGGEGFGYDPIFQPEGFKSSFAEMTMEQKAVVSHRGKAVAKMVGFLASFRS